MKKFAKFVVKAVETAFYTFSVVIICVAVHAFFACSDCSTRENYVREWASKNPKAAEEVANGNGNAILKTFFTTPIAATRLVMVMTWL